VRAREGRVLGARAGAAFFANGGVEPCRHDGPVEDQNKGFPEELVAVARVATA
jgi:hypothetical protein